HPGSRLFNEETFGSYLIWAVPGQQVFIDPRFELYPTEVIVDSSAIGAGIDAIHLLDAYGVDLAFVNKERQPRLIEALARSGAWSREYADLEAEVWRRGGAPR